MIEWNYGARRLHKDEILEWENKKEMQEEQENEIA
jgi:hypothetical protein